MMGCGSKGPKSTETSVRRVRRWLPVTLSVDYAGWLVDKVDEVDPSLLQCRMHGNSPMGSIRCHTLRSTCFESLETYIERALVYTPMNRVRDYSRC